VEGNIRRLKNRITRRFIVRPSYLRKKSKRMEWKGHVKFSGDVRSAYIIFVIRPEGKALLGKNWLKMKTWDRRMWIGFI
jgi:hypothetical protein